MVLKYEDEDISDFRKLKPEDILIRWVNYHLKEAGQEQRIKNLGKDIADSTAMTYVLNQLDKQKCSLNPLKEDDLTKRADQMIENSKKIGVADVVGAEDLVRGNPKVNALFVAEVFNTRNGLLYEGPPVDLDDAGTKEERAFRLWINSLGIENVFINDLYDDLTDGVVLLKVCDKIKPGTVDWKKVCTKSKMTSFDHQYNCEMAFTACETVIGKKQHGLAGGDINRGDKKNIIAIVWQICRQHYLQILGSKTEPQILEWANSVVDEPKISGFGDKKLADSKFLLKVIESIKSGIVNQSLILEGKDEDELKDNAKLAISLARKLGVVIFCTWEDIINPNKKMMLIFIASLFDLSLHN